MIVSKENSLTECYLGRLFLVQLYPLWTFQPYPQHPRFPLLPSPHLDPSLGYFGVARLITGAPPWNWSPWNVQSGCWWGASVCWSACTACWDHMRCFSTVNPVSSNYTVIFQSGFSTALMTWLRHVLLYSLIFLALSKVCEIWKV